MDFCLIYNIDKIKVGVNLFMNNQKDIMKQVIIDEIDMFCDHVAYLEDLFELEKEITPNEEKTVCPDAVKLIDRAIYDAAFMTLSKLVIDDGKQTKSIWSLLKRLEENKHLFDGLEDEITKKVLECKQELKGRSNCIIEKIKTRRDKIIAHNDKKYFSHPEKYTERIPNYELWQVSDQIKKFLEFLIGGIGVNSSTKGKYVQSQDFRRVIKD